MESLVFSWVRVLDSRENDVCPSFNENVCVCEQLTGTINLQKPPLIGALKDFLTFFLACKLPVLTLKAKRN